MDQFLNPETDPECQFLNPETDVKCQFLDQKNLNPESVIMDQFLDPETYKKDTSFWIQKLTFLISLFSGSRKWHYGSVSVFRNWYNGRGEIYDSQISCESSKDRPWKCESNDKGTQASSLEKKVLYILQIEIFASWIYIFSINQDKIYNKTWN